MVQLNHSHDPATLARAWEYHKAADELLHTRLEAFLICHAFLAVAYVQLASSAGFCGLPFMQALGGAVIALALLLTALLVRVNGALLRGVDHLKRQYLGADGVYLSYLEAVSKDFFRTGKGSRLLAIWLPICFVVFWLCVGVQLAAIALTRFGCTSS